MRADADSSCTESCTDCWRHWLGSLCAQAARRTSRSSCCATKSLCCADKSTDPSSPTPTVACSERSRPRSRDRAEPLGRGFRRATRVAQRQAKRAQKDLSTAEGFPGLVAQETISCLAELGCLAAPPTPVEPIPIKRLLDEMALTEHDNGFTLSPTLGQDRRFVSPENRHHCVALPGADLSLAWVAKPTLTNATEPVPRREALLFREWVRFMAPVFGTGMAWVGGYRPDAETFDTEATLVFVKGQWDLPGGGQ